MTEKITKYLAAFFLILNCSLFSQGAKTEEQKELENREEKQSLINDFELQRVNQLGKKFQYEPTQVEELELEKVREHIRRHLEILEHFTEERKKVLEDELFIVILGNSFSDYSNSGFNVEVLSDLLKNMKSVNPNAVFFTGNLINGLKTGGPNRKQTIQLPAEKNAMGESLFGEEEEGIYDKKTFEERLQLFSSLIKSYLPNTPFYPIGGEHEAIGKDSAHLFKQYFNLYNAQIFDTNQLAYKVSLGNSLFVLISTDYFDKDKNQVIEGQIVPEEMQWLIQTLKNDSKRYRFTFVLGNSPAFSSKGVFGIYEGLDKHLEDRNLFWSILQSNRVTTYFSGKEILFDRSYRYGLWQVISGGAGAVPDTSWNEEDVFYHFVLLRIPQKGTGYPSVEVYDRRGRRRDIFDLNPNSLPIYQVQITKSLPDETPQKSSKEAKSER